MNPMANADRNGRTWIDPDTGQVFPTEDATEPCGQVDAVPDGLSADERLAVQSNLDARDALRRGERP